MDYLERKRAQMNIGHALLNRGWTLWGYHPAESDPMTDYRAPASWLGVATHTDHPGVVACVAVADTQRSGWLEAVEEVRASGACMKCVGTGIWPGGLSYAEAMAQPECGHFSAYCAEHNAQPASLQGVSPLHYHDDGSPLCLECQGRKFRYERVVTDRKQWPVFHQTPRGRAWHVEQGGSIRQSGIGLQAAARYADGGAAAERIVDTIAAVVHSLEPSAASDLGTATELAGCQVVHDREWTWLRFDVKPGEAVREALRERLGAAYSPKRLAWYIRRAVAVEEVRAVLEPAQRIDEGHAPSETSATGNEEDPQPQTEQCAHSKYEAECDARATQDKAAPLATVHP